MAHFCDSSDLSLSNTNLPDFRAFKAVFGAILCGLTATKSQPYNRHYRGQNNKPSAEQVGGFLRVRKILKGGKYGTTKTLYFL